MHKSLVIVIISILMQVSINSLPHTATGKDVRSTAYYTIYETEPDGVQTITQMISGKIYTLKASFLFGAFGVAMQGTGRTGPGGDYIHYDGGGGPGEIGAFVHITDEVKQRYAELGIRILLVSVILRWHTPNKPLTLLFLRSLVHVNEF